MNRRFALPALLILIAPLACDDDSAEQTRDDVLVDAAADTSPADAEDVLVDAAADTAPADAGDTRADAPPEVLAAEDYCELTAQAFCGYYLRCGRIASEDAEACLGDFLETCNADFEPRYVALESAGLLELSAEGLAACEAHLEAVACEAQLFDLDGGCAGMWRGRQAEGGTCAPGIESFICEPGTACVLGLDFCGTCTPAAAIGEACGADTGVTCGTGSRCVDGACVERALPGEPCSDAQPCVTGASCEAGSCVGFEVVGVGETCDGRDLRCPYGAICADSACVLQPRLGEACDALPCATGWCDADVCVEKRAAGEACAASTECLGGVCEAGSCTEVPGPPCF